MLFYLFCSTLSICVRINVLCYTLCLFVCLQIYGLFFVCATFFLLGGGFCTAVRDGEAVGRLWDRCGAGGW